ncbi:hypothetical protein [Magnetospirillum sp. UT-4]|uniref:hypothetical protein n=1 Tax=Magnetospirillum sp. UT-4 TaxID=2681467 RepID=UPI001382F448|nr:hypothetical protein [Magnetospirillum sp. UT-4]CAA7626737.1 conserved hypothetical protein [Magnetospirillum sp. UT-4]
MAVKSRSVIIGEIEDHITKYGGDFAEWFIGCTGTPTATLFTKHQVREKGDPWIVRRAKDEYDAHDVVDYFRASRNAKARPREPRDTDLYIYAFKIKGHTKV